MDLRTKLVFALVAVSLASMLALGTLAYEAASRFLEQKSLRQLNSLAEAKKEELEKVILGWQDRVHLIASRTQLRADVNAFNQSEDPELQRQILRILADALGSSSAVQLLAVDNIDGRNIATVGRGPETQLERLAPVDLHQSGDTIVFRGISFTHADEPRADFIAPLVLADQRIGTLHVRLYAVELVDLVENFIGLGETGETMIVLPDSAGTMRILHRGRDRLGDQPGRVRLAEPDDAAYRALRGEQGPFTRGRDYRGEPVWFATRRLPGVEWGVVVKFDAAEERRPILEFRQQLTRLGLSLSAFAILVGTLLGLRFAKPLHNLARVADRIRLGELDARATVVREDELGLLARTFNQMAEELERQVTLLHEFQRYFEVSLDMLCIAGTDAYFKRVNPAFERTLGWTEEELLSRPFIDFVHPDDVEATRREIERLSRGIPTVSFENRYRCADGSYKKLLWTTYPEPETGLLYAIARDITHTSQASDRG